MDRSGQQTVRPPDSSRGEFIPLQGVRWNHSERVSGEARLLSTQGDIYMGGVNGLLCINKQLPDEPNAPPILELADVWVGGERMNALMSTGRRLKVEEQEVSPSPLKSLPTIKISSANRCIVIPYSAWKGQVIYSYQPELTLSGLPARTYQVMASCSTRTGGWTKRLSDSGTRSLTTVVQIQLVYQYLFHIDSFRGNTGILLPVASQENKLKWAMKEHRQQVYEERNTFPYQYQP